MRFLIDTNAWLQIVREREHADEVRQFLAAMPPGQIGVTDFALHSILLVMKRHKVLDRFPEFIRLSGIGDTVELVRLRPLELALVVDACRVHGLDVDDAFQYVAAELRGADLVSFDDDFDRTPRGRLTPAAALQRFRDEQ